MTLFQATEKSTSTLLSKINKQLLKKLNRSSKRIFPLFHNGIKDLVWPIKHGAKLLFLQLFNIKVGMGNQQLLNPQDKDEICIQQLCSLTQRCFIQPYKLSVDPFNTLSTTENTYVFSDMEISSPADQYEETQPVQTVPNNDEAQEESQSESMKQVHNMASQNYTQSLQKNQNVKNTTFKTKQIKKENNQKKSKTKKEGINVLGVELYNQESIRDQNNCKSYHKLVKNYLIQNRLQYLIKEYDDKYHTRYYFLMALILIKHYLTSDFYPIYQQLVQKQVNIQKGKIMKKQKQISSLNAKIKQFQLKGQDTSKMQQKKAKLEKQIIHIKVVIFEIENYSKRCCYAYFNNETEQALNILYMKNDPVMRKKYYFDTAIKIINDLEDKVRKEVSHC